MTEIYDFKAKSLDGAEICFDKYRNKLLLIVNTASKCGYTPQYTGLEELHKKFVDKGLVVLGFPCDQFGHQEPGNSHEIAEFCQKNYGVSFQMFDKVEVNGPGAHPIFNFLTTRGLTKPTEAIKWNFAKFIVDHNGKVIKYYTSDIKPSDMANEIEELLNTSSCVN